MLRKIKISPIRLTKIIVTYGPSISKMDILKKCFQKGADILRYNFSHGNVKEFQEVVKKIEKIERELDRFIPIFVDLQGPKFRVDISDCEFVDVKNGETLEIFLEKPGESRKIFLPHPELSDSIKPGNKIFIEDGKIRLSVKEISHNKLILKVIKGGRIFRKKGINLPDAMLKVPSLTEKDIRDVKNSLKYRVDYFCLSFVKEKEDILKLKEIAQNTKIIAKIEKPQALENIEEIIDASDGIMVARGDLGIEVEIEKIGIIQKEIVKKCKEKKKPVIIATQMLESMMNSLIPTRAEATDITNGVLDGADSLMLSGETSIGNYPLNAVEVMDRIIGYSQEHEEREKYISNFHPEELTEAISHSAALAMYDLKIEKCIIFTVSGRTAYIISHFHPYATIFAFSPDIKVCREISLLYGISSFYLPYFNNSDTMINKGIEVLKEKKLLRSGERVVVLCGNVENISATNIMRIADIK